MTTPPTPQDDLREIVMAELRPWVGASWMRERLADAVLAAVEPVIRQQERATTADEIANDLAARANADDLEYWGANEAEVLRRAAAIARSHSTQRGEETK